MVLFKKMHASVQRRLQYCVSSSLGGVESCINHVIMVLVAARKKTHVINNSIYFIIKHVLYFLMKACADEVLYIIWSGAVCMKQAWIGGCKPLQKILIKK